MTIWDGVGAVINKITQWIPGKVEKLKNERENLLNERNYIKAKGISPSGSRRIVAIDARLQQIDNIIRNAAKD